MGSLKCNKLACWGCRTLYTELQRTTLDESSGKMNEEGNNPVVENVVSLVDPEYDGAREIPSESGRTIS